MADLSDNKVLPAHWRKRLNPAQQAEVAALFGAYREENSDGQGFEAWLALQGWALPGAEKPVEELLETITAHLGTDADAGDVGIPQGNQRYTLIEHLGLGDMGRIELVRELTLQRKVAMKLIRQHSDPALLRRFLIEAQVTAQLDHPHIVPIYSLENTSAGLAYTMKRVQGRTFSQLVSDCAAFYTRGGQPDAEHGQSQRLDYFLAVCEALEYAHSRGVVHRELAPDNLMLGHFHEVYVMNWGSSRLLPAAQGIELQLPPQLDPLADLGSPLAGQVAYFSPEQVAGGWARLDARSDGYVLGLILYELLCLRPALQGATPLELLERAGRAELGPMIDPAGKRLPRELRAILARATALAPEARYAGVAELAADLRRYQRGEAVSARRDSPLQAASRWLVRHQLAALALVMGLVMLSAAIGVWSLWSQQQELARVQAREQALNGFLAAVYQQSRVMNRQFLRAESQLESLASVAVAQFTQARPATDSYLLHEHFHPGGLVDSSQYHSRISVDWPLSVKTWSLPEAQVAPWLSRLSPLRQAMQRILVESQTYEPLSPAARERLIASTGTPVTYATIILRQGAGAWLPGGDFDAPTYDPVKRPFYLFGAHQHARRWGNPYIDVSGAGLLLIGATGLFDHQGQFLGTASLDLKFDTIIKSMLDLPRALKKLRGGFLLDELGRVAIRSSQQGKKFSATIHPNIKLPLYNRPEVVKAIRARESGHVILASENPLLVAYYRLPALGWYYVVEADLEQALKASQASQASQANQASQASQASSASAPK